VGLTSALLLLLSGAAMLVTVARNQPGQRRAGYLRDPGHRVGTGSDITHYQNVTLAITK